MEIQIWGCKANWAGNLANPTGSLAASSMLRQVVAEQHLKMWVQRQPGAMTIQIQRCEVN
jgi:hypothetical protein